MRGYEVPPFLRNAIIMDKGEAKEKRKYGDGYDSSYQIVQVRRKGFRRFPKAFFSAFSLSAAKRSLRWVYDEIDDRVFRLARLLVPTDGCNPIPSLKPIIAEIGMIATINHDFPCFRREVASVLFAFSFV